MNLTKAQLRAVGHLVKPRTDGAKLYMIRREKITSVKQSFASGVIAYDDEGQEVGVAFVNGRVVDGLNRRGLIEKVGGDSVTGILFKASDTLMQSKAILDKSRGALGERPTHETLAKSADKFACKIVFDRTPMLFKVVRQDGRKFTKPYVDVSLYGIKVTRLTDLTIQEWESEIAEVIKRSDLI